MNQTATRWLDDGRAAPDMPCERDHLLRWPDVFAVRRDQSWPAPRTAVRLTVLLALGDGTGLDALWASLSLTGQVNVIAALAAQARAGVLEAQQGGPVPLSLCTLLRAECPGVPAAAAAALTGAHRWQIPACPACLRAAAEALAELRITSWQAITSAPRTAIAHILTR